MPAGIDLKDLFALLPVLSAVFTYYGLSAQRLKRAERAKSNYSLGHIYSLANIWPHRLNTTITVLIMVMSVAYFATKFFGELKSSPYIGSSLAWITEYYWYFFVGWLAFVIVVYFQIIERTALALLGLSSRCRETVDWANANWHIQDDSPQAPTLAPSQDGLIKMANLVIDDLVSKPPNLNLALRPANVDNAVAANILFFGHVIEGYTTAVGGPRFPWTPFYEALGQVSMLPNHPFAPESLARIDCNSASFVDDVLMLMNDHVDPDFPKLKNEAKLEQLVADALRILQTSYGSDARKIARGWFGNSYEALLRNSQQFFPLEEIRRQFAKLITLWQVVDHLHRPEIFKVPFSGGIFLMYLNTELLHTESERFSRDDLGVHLCFEDTQHRLMQMVRMLIESSLEHTRATWRGAEMRLVNGRDLDWEWWIFYRTDQHTYHLGREHEQKPWKPIDNGKTFIKAKG
jgi:hypothetical protein